jgi:hypothetical protein
MLFSCERLQSGGRTSTLTLTLGPLTSSSASALGTPGTQRVLAGPATPDARLRVDSSVYAARELTLAWADHRADQYVGTGAHGFFHTAGPRVALNAGLDVTAVRLDVWADSVLCTVRERAGQ